MPQHPDRPLVLGGQHHLLPLGEITFIGRFGIALVDEQHRAEADGGGHGAPRRWSRRHVIELPGALEGTSDDPQDAGAAGAGKPLDGVRVYLHLREATTTSNPPATSPAYAPSGCPFAAAVARASSTSQ